MNLYRHYIEYDSECKVEGKHIHYYQALEYSNVIEKEKSFYGTVRVWDNQPCKPYKLMNKSDYKKLILYNKDWGRLRFGFIYWSDVKLSEETLTEMVKGYLLETIKLKVKSLNDIYLKLSNQL